MTDTRSLGRKGDPWVFDTFTWFDHDYRDEENLEKVIKCGYKLFGNWPFLLKDESSVNPLEAKIKVLLVGGSTTSVVNDSTWSKHLFQVLAQKFNSVAVFNGGCGLYNSFNEYMKISRDILFMNPTHVISLSGVNDTNAPRNVSNGFAHMLVDPLVSGNMYTRHNTDFPAIERVVRWLDESKSINAICQSHDIQFHRFLQPCLCSHSSPFDELSDELKELVHWIGNFLGTGTEQYKNAVMRFYYSLNQAQFPEYISDISDVVPNEIQYWHDARHPTDLGYELIGKKIASSIF